ncbi:MAG TPA: class I SAM-dependent methyltransferase, partial [Blastocatellia bacterium]|nr:class I SAM-dependent methyltransferase [Blastocatellia bacterium]
MREEEYRAMFDVEERLWWYEGMRAITATILDHLKPQLNGGRLLDVGCGTGFSMKWLRERFNSSAAFGVDVSEHATEFWRKTGLDTV